MGSTYLSLRADKPSIVFLYWGSFHLYFDAGNTTLIGSCHLYSDGEIFSTRETAPLWDFLHMVSTVGFTLTQRYQIVTLIYLGPQLGVDTSNLSLGDIPTSKYFLQVSQDHDYS